MHRHQWAVALLGSMAGTCWAQSGVIAYGVADAGVEYANHQPNGNQSTVRLTSGNMSGSRWGLRGTEDLGGSLKAIFALEGGITIDDGKSSHGGRLFGRQAWVGLQSRYGTLTLGRHTTPMFELGANYDPMALAGRYSIGAIEPTLQSRADNSIKYTARAGAFTAKAFYSFGADGTSGTNGEVPGHGKVGREYSLGAGYDQGPFSVSVVYDELRGNTIATESDASRKAAIGASYLAGKVKTFVGYRYARGTAAAATSSSNLVWAGASWDVGNAWNLTGVVYYQDLHGSAADPAMLVLSADYAFSKRTDGYMNVAYTRNKAGSNLGASGFGTVTPDANQTAAVIGIRHKF